MNPASADAFRAVGRSGAATPTEKGGKKWSVNKTKIHILSLFLVRSQVKYQNSKIQAHQKKKKKEVIKTAVGDRGPLHFVQCRLLSPGRKL